MNFVCDNTHTSCQFQNVPIGTFFVMDDYYEDLTEDLYIKVAKSESTGNGAAIKLGQSLCSTFSWDTLVYPIELNEVHYSYKPL